MTLIAKIRETVTPILQGLNMNYHITRSDYGASVGHENDISNDIRAIANSVYLHLYQYDDDPEALYIGYISILEEYRANGLGNWALTVSLTIARALGCSRVVLAADSTKFMYKWYKRKGFKYLMDYEEGSTFHWLELTLY